MIGALKDHLCMLARRWIVYFGHGAVTEGMGEASWEWGVKEVRNGKAANFVFVGATDPEPKNQETQMTPAWVPVYWS